MLRILSAIITLALVAAVLLLLAVFVLVVTSPPSGDAGAPALA